MVQNVLDRRDEGGLNALTGIDRILTERVPMRFQADRQVEVLMPLRALIGF